MRNADVKELQRRMTKTACTFTRMSGCYVNANKDILTTFNETFLNLEDAEFYKYLDIAKATTKGRLGNNLIELTFEGAAGQQSLERLRTSKLKDTELLGSVYDMIINSYDYVGNYLIVIFHDAYDVIMKTSDGEKLDESEEVFEYLLCAICPVNLTKPGLEYNEEEHAILPRVRDWVVKMPETGFMWPAFTDRQEDRDAVMFFTKDAKHPHKELCEIFLETKEFMTHAERHEDLKDIVKEILGEDTEYYGEINAKLLELVEYAPIQEGVETQVVIDGNEMHKILDDLEISEEQRRKVEKQYVDTCRRFGYPTSIELLDEKAAKKAQETTTMEWQKNRMERMKMYLKLAHEQLISPTEDKETVCNGIAELIGE